MLNHGSHAEPQINAKIYDKIRSGSHAEPQTNAKMHGKIRRTYAYHILIRQFLVNVEHLVTLI